MPALMPRSKRNATIPALVFDVLEAADHVGYTTKAEAGTEDESPDTVDVEHSNQLLNFKNRKNRQ